MTYERQRAISSYGWTAVPASLTQLISTSPTAGAPAPALPLTSLPFPSTPLARSIQTYAQQELPPETFHHSMRVYHYGVAILVHAFPSWSPITPESPLLETYALVALLHDVGTAPKYLLDSLMSFEFLGALVAEEVLRGRGAPREQRDLVVEGIVRHQDLGEVGFQTRIGGLLQLATILDNVGGNGGLVDRGTIEGVVGAWPRLGWSKCFAHTIQQENGLKPWAHTTHLGVRDFPEGVMDNKLMEEWE